MSNGNNAASIAAQIEAIRPELPELMLLQSVLWGRFQARTDMTAVGSRPTRVPTQPITGGLFGVFGPDGSDMGLGSGPQEVPGYLSCAYYLQASQYTAQAEWSTDSSAKAIQDYVALTHKQAAQTFGGYMDTLAQGDGSNTIDTVVSTTGGGIVVNNANFFQSNQLVDIWSGLGGVFRGTVQIEVEDIQSNTIWLIGAVPAGTVAGDLLMVHGASAQANTGIFGLGYWDVSGNTGNFMGIPRASFPGRYSAQNVNRGGGALTPASFRALKSNIELAMGSDQANKVNAVAHCNVDQRDAWENNALTVQTINAADVRGNQSVDMLKKERPSEMGGIPILLNNRAKPGRVDVIPLDNFWRLEVKPMDYYDVGGQTVFPAIGGSGGITSSNLFYMVVGTQIGINNARLNGYMSNCSIPAGLLGR